MKPNDIEIDCLLDDDFQQLQHLIYEDLGFNTPNSPAQKALIQSIKADLTEFRYTCCTNPRGLTTKHLSEIEIILSMQADRAGTYGSGSTVDNDEYATPADDEGGTFLLPHEELENEAPYPRTVKRFHSTNLKLRGERLPIYDAIEQYIANNTDSEKYITPNAVIHNVARVLTHIREGALQHYTASYTEDLSPLSDRYKDEAKKANQHADGFMKQILETKNISQDGHKETIRGALNRLLGKPAVDQYFNMNAPGFRSSPKKMFLMQLTAQSPQPHTP